MGASATAGRWRRSLHHRSNAFLGVLKVKPRQLLIGEHMLARFQLLRPVERTDTIMRLGRKMHGRASQRRAAADTETARGSRRRLEHRDGAFGHRDRVVLEADEHAHRGAGMSAAAVAMAPEDSLGFATCFETYRPTQAAP